MKKYIDHNFLLFSGFTLLLIAGMTSLASSQKRIQLKFSAEISGEPFKCGTEYKNIGTTSSTVLPSDYRFYISNVNLIDTHGNLVPVSLDQDGVWQSGNIALLDFEDGSGPCQNGNPQLNDMITGLVPNDEYEGLEFTLGVPFDVNHQDVLMLPSPLNLSAMFWNWQGGHRFFKVDMATSGRPVPATSRTTASVDSTQTNPPSSGGSGMGGTGEEEAAGFSIHLGSTGCASASRTTPPASHCKNPNQVIVRFDQFNTDNNIVITDIGRVLKDTNVDVNTEDTAPGCMSGLRDPECADILPAFGLGAEAGEQQLFYQR